MGFEIERGVAHRVDARIGVGRTSRWFHKAACVLVLAGAGVLALDSRASANGMRCDNKIVDRGDTAYQVKSLCGPPDDARQRIERRSVRRVVQVPCATGRCSVVVEDMIEVAVEEWLYDFGPQRFIQHLTFEEGKLVDVQSGSYGTKQI